MSGRRKRHTALLLALALGMFGFAFALVPLYEVFCELTGLNGRTTGRATVADSKPLAEGRREVTIQLLGRVARGLPWEFRPTQDQLRVRVGELHTTTFHARNRSADLVIGQAVPSVSPGQAAVYLKKLECFCFSQQELAGGGEKEMPVSFYVAADLPEEISELSLSYTMFRVDPPAPEQAARR